VFYWLFLSGILLSVLGIPFKSLVNPTKTCKAASEVSFLVRKLTETFFYQHTCTDTDSIFLAMEISNLHPHSSQDCWTKPQIMWI